MHYGVRLPMATDEEDYKCEGVTDVEGLQAERGASD